MTIKLQKPKNHERIFFEMMSDPPIYKHCKVVSKAIFTSVSEYWKIVLNVTRLNQKIHVCKIYLRPLSMNITSVDHRDPYNNNFFPVFACFTVFLMTYGFVKSTNILGWRLISLDAITFLKETVAYYNKEHTDVHCVMVDLSKAHDRINMSSLCGKSKATYLPG